MIFCQQKIRRRRMRIRPGGRQRRRLEKTYLIPNKHPSPILVLHQFSYFPIGEVHSKVEVAHPNLAKKKRGRAGGGSQGQSVSELSTEILDL